MCGQALVGIAEGGELQNERGLRRLGRDKGNS